MGSFNSSETELFARENCFSPTPPRCSLLNVNGDPMTVIWDPNYACSQGDIIGYSVIDRGNGILDSIPLRSSYSEPISIEDRLYGQLNDHFDNGNYLDAVITAKHIISDYPSCQYLSEALSRMDKAYNILDTFSNMQQRVILWGDFNLYLENKIASGNYDSKFCDAMYEMTLECLTNMGEFYDAKLGYDMIAMYNPNPNERLLATWDADALEDLLNGAGGNKGGSINENTYLNLDDQEISRIKDLNQNSIITKKEDLKKLEMISSSEDIKPIKETIKLMYQKEVKSNESKKVNIVNGRKILLPQQKDYAAIEIKKQSIRSARKEDKDKLRTEHLMLVGGLKSESVGSKENSVVSNFSLSQNFPNPFNPTTNIKYSLPKSGFVLIKVYDMVGRMVKELVNEVKDQGNYSVTFDGASFASGVYFYRIEAISFVDTKRMVLVK